MSATSEGRKADCKLSPFDFKGSAPAGVDEMFQGAMVMLNSSGFAVDASADNTLIMLGRCSKGVDNSAGDAGDLDVEYEEGIFEFESSGIAADDIGKPVFVVDNQTVSLSSNSGARPLAGMVHSIKSSTKTFVLCGLCVSKFMSMAPALSVTALTDNSGGATGDDTIAVIPDPSNTPTDADALRDDLVATVLPPIRNAISDLAAKMNELLTALGAN